MAQPINYLCTHAYVVCTPPRIFPPRSIFTRSPLLLRRSAPQRVTDRRVRTPALLLLSTIYCCFQPTRNRLYRQVPRLSKCSYTLTVHDAEGFHSSAFIRHASINISTLYHCTYLHVRLIAINCFRVKLQIVTTTKDSRKKSVTSLYQVQFKFDVKFNVTLPLSFKARSWES